MNWMLNYQKDNRNKNLLLVEQGNLISRRGFLKRGMAVTIAGNFSLLLEVCGPKLIEMRLRSARTQSSPIRDGGESSNSYRWMGQEGRTTDSICSCFFPIDIQGVGRYGSSFRSHSRGKKGLFSNSRCYFLRVGAHHFLLLLYQEPTHHPYLEIHSFQASFF